MDKDNYLVEAECVKLCNAFCFHLDRRNYRALADLFTPEGAWIRHGIPLAGRSAIIAALEERPADLFTRHVIAGHHFTHISEDRAASTAYNISYYSRNGGILPALLVPDDAIHLDFSDSYERTAAGWRFAERNSVEVFLSTAAKARVVTLREKHADPAGSRRGRSPHGRQPEGGHDERLEIRTSL